ncbi:MAG TPA: hypothetical protein VF828_00845 [Patescibacteria group bacterium]
MSVVRGIEEIRGPRIVVSQDTLTEAGEKYRSRILTQKGILPNSTISLVKHTGLDSKMEKYFEEMGIAGVRVSGNGRFDITFSASYGGAFGIRTIIKTEDSAKIELPEICQRISWNGVLSLNQGRFNILEVIMPTKGKTIPTEARRVKFAAG